MEERHDTANHIQTKKTRQNQLPQLDGVIWEELWAQQLLNRGRSRKRRVGSEECEHRRAEPNRRIHNADESQQPAHERTLGEILGETKQRLNRE